MNNLTSLVQTQEAAIFGEVDMGYDEMYQSLYLAGEPCTFIEYVRCCCGDDIGQDNFWTIANEVAPEIGLDGFDAVQRVNPMVVEMVNYKGEGEGVFLYDEAKEISAGTYRSKYNYTK